MNNDLDRLMARLGYRFNDIELLALALTHRSVSRHRNYERLEFLGDAQLGQIISIALFERFPDAAEGQLTRMRASLVRGQTLALVARELGLGDYLVLGGGELKSGGFRRDSILADSVEAVIGAIYLDSDMDTVRGFILGWYKARLEQINLKKSQKDSKTRLQEFLQSRRIGLPQYELIKVEGEAHDQTFYILCHVEMLEQPTKGIGSSRRQAEQEAARAAIELLQVEKS